MSVNIPKDPYSLDSSNEPSRSADVSPPTRSSAPTKDSLEVASTDPAGTTRVTPRESAGPQLKVPQSTDDSIVGAFKYWNDIIRAFKLSASDGDKTNLQARRKFSQLAATQAQEVSKLLEEKAAALATLQKDIEQNLAGLQKKLEEMQELAKEQQKGIDQINTGNEQETQEYEKLASAYETYVSELKRIGVVDQGNGKFLIPDEPKEAKDQYNQLTEEYQQAVTAFNDYWKGRSDQINKYNVAAAAYNQNVAEYNKAVNEFISKNQLSDYVKDKGIVIPQLPSASRRDLSSYQKWIAAPSTITSTRFPVSIAPLPDYVRSIAQAGPPPLPKLKDFPPFDTQSLYAEMYKTSYDSTIAPFDQAINQYTSYWSFLRQNIENLDRDLSSNSLLNSKVLTQRLLSPKLSSSQTSTTPSSSLAMQAMGINDPHLQTLLGQALLKEALTSANLKAVEHLNQEEKEKKVEQLTDQILLLSVGLLGNQSMQALFPSLSLISNHLTSLPKDSPAFAILFAISLSNRIQEDVQQGATAEALEFFIKANPELATLTPEDQTKLEAIINLGQLFVAGKLLEDNLGLKGLLAQIVPSLLPDLNLEKAIPQAEQENQQESTELQTQIQNHFVAQGYSEEKAQFLAQVSVELTQNGLLMPNLTSHISSKTLHQPLLENSVKAALVLANYSLKEAGTIAHEAIDRTLLEGPYSSLKQFRRALEENLNDQQVSNSPEVVKAAILIPRTETTLPPFPATPVVEPSISVTPTAPSASSPTPSITASVSPIPQQTTPTYAKLSLTELTTLLEKRALQLLVPQLGTQLAKQVSQEIAQTLFGTPNPDSRDVAAIKSPYALVNVIKNQLYHLNVENNQKWTNALTETFKESIKTLESFYAFSLKLMDPAYLFVFASGIIYGDRGREKAIDIQI